MKNILFFLMLLVLNGVVYFFITYDKNISFAARLPKIALASVVMSTVIFLILFMQGKMKSNKN